MNEWRTQHAKDQGCVKFLQNSNSPSSPLNHVSPNEEKILWAEIPKIFENSGYGYLIWKCSKNTGTCEFSIVRVRKLALIICCVLSTWDAQSWLLSKFPWFSVFADWFLRCHVWLSSCRLLMSCEVVFNDRQEEKQDVGAIQTLSMNLNLLGKLVSL